MKSQNIWHVIAREFKKDRIPCAVIGGFAVNLYRPARHTADIDFLVLEKDYPQIRERLIPYGYKQGPVTKIFARLEACGHQIMDLDFLFVDAPTLEKIIKQGKKISIAGHFFIAPSLEHLIALKLHAIKNNPQVRELKDLFDILEMIEANRLNVKTEKFQKLCLDYGSRDLYDKIQSHFKRKPS